MFVRYKKERKGVINLEDKGDYLLLKAGQRTYFFNIRKTKKGENFLIITESIYKGEGQERERKSLMVFRDQVEKFAGLTAKAAEKVLED